MRAKDHEIRVRRMLRGDIQLSDIQFLFSDLRMMKPGFESVREIGHFAAHRDERDAGIILERICQIQESFLLWFAQKDIAESGGENIISHIERAANVNMKIMTKDSIEDKFGLSIQTVTQTFNKAVRKFKAGKPLKERESNILVHFGLSGAWEVSFHSRTLFDDFTSLLSQEGALEAKNSQDLEGIYRSVSIYALSLMHGAKLILKGGEYSSLTLSIDKSGGLWVRANIPLFDRQKETVMQVPLFVTDLPANDYCSKELLSLLKIGDLSTTEFVELKDGALVLMS